MKSFIYSYPTKNYFGIGCVKENLPGILGSYGENVLLAYGGGSIKKNGVYEELMDILNTAGKKVTEFSDIMPNRSSISWGRIQTATMGRGWQ